jgi:PTH1 family peptidyl-tRNA hydrolase
LSRFGWLGSLFRPRAVEVPGQPASAPDADWGEFEPVQIWVGLGNPGAKHAMHRHNVGFMAADAIAEVHGFEPTRKAFSGWTRQGRIGGERILILKPATWMNESGRSVRAAMDYFKKEAGDVTVFHDELDLAPFKVKAKVGGGTAGHNGLRSTEAHIGNDFRRVRIGIGHPGHKDRVTGHVLGNYAKAETERLSDMLAAVAAEAEWLAKGDDARFMNEVALRLQD